MSMIEDEKSNDKLSVFSNFNIEKIQKERKKEKTTIKKLDVVRKLYNKTK
jgi:hypothetical protein